MPDDFDLLVRDVERMERVFLPELMKAENATGEAAQVVAHKYSSGTVSTAQLETPTSKGGFGAPYGHGATGWLGPRGPIPYGDPAMINRQTGAFYEAWMRLLASMSGDAISTVLANFDIAANYLSKRTGLAIRRPIDDRIVEDTKQIRLTNLDKAMKRIFRFK